MILKLITTDPKQNSDHKQSSFITMTVDESSKKKKESIVDLSRFIDKKVRVKFQGGREAAGILKGYDQLLNLVLDNATEFLRDPEDPLRITDETRNLGLIVARGTAITVVAPNEGIEQIANPFVTADAEE